jgi:hypothetical protein
LPSQESLEVRARKSRKLLPPFRHSCDSSAVTASLQSTNYILVHSPRTRQVRSMTSLLSSDVLLYRPVLLVLLPFVISGLAVFALGCLVGRSRSQQARRAHLVDKWMRNISWDAGRGRISSHFFYTTRASSWTASVVVSEHLTLTGTQAAANFVRHEFLEMHKEARRRSVITIHRFINRRRKKRTIPERQQNEHAEPAVREWSQPSPDSADSGTGSPTGSKVGSSGHAQRPKRTARGSAAKEDSQEGKQTPTTT